MVNKNSSGGRFPSGFRPSLYSARIQEFSSLESTLRGSQIFSGDQPDDFAIAGLIGDSPRILMLGAGVGSGIRGIVAANPMARITAVDNSAGQIAVLESLFLEYFPEIKFSVVHADAENLAKKITPEKQFDAICVDLYTGSDYVEFVTRENWWNSIRDLYLAPQGIIFANSWGLPTHMDPLGKDTAQSSMYKAMYKSLGDIEVHSFRRNLTYSSKNFKKINNIPHSSWTHLEELDQIWLNFIRIRFSNPYIPSNSIFSRECDNKNYESRSKEYIDILMHRKWKDSLESNRKILSTLKRQPTSDNFLDNMLHALASTNKPDRDLLPNQWSVAEIETGEIPEVFIYLTQKLGNKLSQIDRQWYVDVWVTQLISFALKSSPAFRQSPKYKYLIETIQSEIEKLEVLQK